MFITTQCPASDHPLKDRYLEVLENQRQGSEPVRLRVYMITDSVMEALGRPRAGRDPRLRCSDLAGDIILLAVDVPVPYCQPITENQARSACYHLPNVDRWLVIYITSGLPLDS